VVPQYLQQHRGEAKDGIGGETFGVRQASDGEKGTEDIGVAVYQKEFFKKGHGLLYKKIFSMGIQKINSFPLPEGRG
jgi:hypothetical protein